MLWPLFIDVFEDDDVVKPKDFENHQQFFLRLGEVAEEELDIDVSRRRGLDSVDHAEEMADGVVIDAGKDSDQEVELRYYYCYRI